MPNFNRVMQPFNGEWFFSIGDEHAIIGKIISHNLDYHNVGLKVFTAKNVFGVIGGKLFEGKLDSKMLGFDIFADRELRGRMSSTIKEKFLITKVFNNNV